jgi:hypothetical protein
MTIAGSEQSAKSETAAGSYPTTVDLESRSLCDVAVDVTGAATLTVQVSSSGEFDGEEYEVTVDYDSATEIIEQFGFAHRYVRAKVDQNLSSVEVVGRGL